MSEPEESSGNENWVLGVTLGLLGSIAINTGNNIQSLGLKSLQNQEKIGSESEKNVVARQRTASLPSLATPLGSPTREQQTSKDPNKRQSLPWLSPVRTTKTAATDEEEDSNEFVVVKVKNKSPVQSLTWVIGTVIFISGSMLNFASYAFAAQSLLASLESVQFVTNLLFGKLLLKAHVTQTMLAGTCLTVVGTLMAVQFSSKETLELNTDDMKALYKNPAYITYLVMMAVGIVVLQIMYITLKQRERINKAVKHSDIILPIVYSISSALFGTQSVVQAKVLAELLAVQSNGDENIFKSWFTYVTFGLWLLTAVVWLQRLNGALKMFNPLFIIPLLQCSFIFFTIVSGGIFFKEFNAFDLSQWMGFWFGIVVMFAGLILLTPKPKSSKDDELHRALVNLLLESKGVSNLSIERTPRSPAGNNNNKSDGLSPNDDDMSDTRRFERLSKDNNNITTAALDAVKDVFSGDQSTQAYSEVMLQNTVDADSRRRRRNALEKLLQLIKDNPISHDGRYTEEITSLIGELRLDFTVATPPTPGPVDVRDIAKAHSNLHSQILLEIEQNRTPVPPTSRNKSGYKPLDDGGGD